MDAMKVASASDRHAASHDVEDGCCAMLKTLMKIMDTVYVIEARSEMRAVKSALEGLHEAAKKAHDSAIREMKN